jgi:hypothetical protein
VKPLVLLLAAAALAVVVGGVVSEDDSAPAGQAGRAAADPEPGGAAGSMLAPSSKLAGEGITIEEALVAETPESLLVRGYLITDGNGLRLCTALDGGRCVAPALEIEGEPGIEPDGPEPVTVLGALDGRTLVAVNLAAA